MNEESEQRPWGSWHNLDVGEGYKVKRIEVEPHQRLSYQTHEHRAEHWVVVTGKATCVIDGVTTISGPGETLQIGVGQAHRIANAEAGKLVIIEVQLGRICAEGDIQRLEDDYGRVE